MDKLQETQIRTDNAGRCPSLPMQLLRSVGVALVLVAVSPLAHAAEGDAFFTKAQELTQRGEVELAIELYKKGLELDPQSSSARIEYAELLREYGRLEDASAVYEKGVELDPGNVDLHKQLADVLQSLGQLEQAQSHYRTAYELDPNSAAGVDAYVNLLRLEQVRDEPAASPTATIEWSDPAAGGKAEGGPAPDVSGPELAKLRARLDNNWCLQWIDVYSKRDGVCRSNIADGDFVFVDPPEQVAFRFDAQNRLTSAAGLEPHTDIRFDWRQTESVSTELADRSIIHTLRYRDGRYFEFEFNNRERACFQMTARRDGDEQKECSNSFTFCECEAPTPQLSSVD